MKKVLALLISVLLLATMIPLGVISVSAEQPTDAGWVWPVDGGAYVRGFAEHSGVDISAGVGVAVKSINSGTVICASKATASAEGYCDGCGRKGAGYHVTVRHVGGIVSLYAHLSDVCVYSGQEVVAGQQVGNVGETGYAFGAHLHLSLFVNQQYDNHLHDANLVDPLHYITPFRELYVTDITETGAVIHGNFGAYSNALTTQVGAYVGSDPTAMTRMTDALAVGQIKAWYTTSNYGVTLQPETVYYYQLWMMISGIEYRTAIRTFTTGGGHTHSFGLWTATKGATCGADGELIRTCGCGASETQVIPATGAHTYDDDYDATCNGCAAVREVPEKPPVNPDLPADAPAFVVESVTAREGEEVTVAVRTQRNSGIVSLKLSVAYDADVLELVSVQEQDFANVVFSPLASNPVIINWVDAIHPDNTTNGMVALLTFRVKEGAPIGVTDITLTYDPEDVYDENYDNVGFRVENGGVEVVDYLPGDINGDGKINNKDLGVLQQYLSDWEVTVVELAADTNGDGKINNKDLGRLQQYLSDWDVELG